MSESSQNGHSSKRVLSDVEMVRNFEELVGNIAQMRGELLGRLIDPRRNVFAECGWPQSLDVTPDQYRQLYDREPIATRVVQLMPKECWAIQPEVYEDEQAKTKTEFELAWDELGSQLTGGQSWYKDEKGSPVWEYLERVDILSGIGHFGVLLLGVDDGKALDTPLDGVVSLEPTGKPLPSSDVAKPVKNTMRERLVVNGMPTGAWSTPAYPPGNLKFGGRSVQNEKGEWCYQGGFEGTAREMDAEALRLKGERDKQQIALNAAFEDRGNQTGTVPQTAKGDLFRNDGNKNASTQDEYATFPYGNLGTDAQYMGVQFGPSEYPSAQVAKEQRKLLFLRPFDESLVQIVQYEANLRNPRFGQPVMYLITLNDPREWYSGIGLPLATIRVHWSRVIHIADDLNSSEVIGTPRIRPVLNPILDIQKIRGGSAEGYWRGAFPGLSLTTQPQLGGDVKVDVTSIRSQLENWSNSLQRFLLTTGMTATMLSPTVSSPTDQINVQIQTVCIQKAIPLRIFQGAERGQLASQQDDSNWNDRVRGRQNGYLTPRVIRPFIDRLIACHVLPEPDSWSCKWPDLESLSDKDKAAIAQTRTSTLSSYVGGGVENLIPPLEFFTKILGIHEEEAKAILDAGALAAKGDEAQSAPDMAQAKFIASGAAAATGVEALLDKYTSGALDVESTKVLLTEFFLFSDTDAQTLIDGSKAVTPPAPAAPPPMKLKQGESLVNPSDGTPVAASNKPPETDDDQP